MTANLLDLFKISVDAHGNRVALVEADGSSVTFDEIAAAADKLAGHWQQQGLTNGDTVLIAMPVSANLYISLAALWQLGVTVVLPEPSMGVGGLQLALQATHCKGFVAAGKYRWIKYLLPSLWLKPMFSVKRWQSNTQSSRQSLGVSALRGSGSNHNSTNKRNAVTITYDKIALISFTSGSTNKPKAIARSHGFLAAQYAAIAPLLESDGVEVDLVAFPVFVLINLAAGRTSVLPNWKMNRLDKLNEKALYEWIESQQVTRALLPPSACEVLARSKPLTTLSTVFTGGGPVFLDVVEAMQENQSSLTVVAVYGSTESEPIAHLDFTDVSEADKAAMRQGKGLLAGKPVPEVTLVIENDEILVAGAHVNQGYLDSRQDAETKVLKGNVVFHRTGDAGRLDEQGRIWLLGRFGKGTNGLYPFSIESAVRLWLGVDRAAFSVADGRGVLAIEGDTAYLNEWKHQAAVQFDIQHVVHIQKMPLDRRHRSKIDYTKLGKLLAKY